MKNDLIQIDAIVMFKYLMNGYIITERDEESKFGFVYGYSNLSSSDEK